MDMVEAPARGRSPWSWVKLGALLLPLQLGTLGLIRWFPGRGAGIALLFFVALSAVQLVLGLIALGVGLARRTRTGLGAALSGLLLACVGGVGGFFGVLGALFAGGGAWGRPLRIRGRQLHPELRAGSDWTAGARPDAQGLDPDTRAALEALWLHDAQKEHASVPAFARVSWLLAAAGAPAELLAWCHRAALEEIEHSQRCFALAAGYGGRSHTVEPMPELVAGGLDVRGDALALLATESLSDGCLLEDFNADVAAACSEVCDEPVTRAVLERIAAEERSHAELSWAIVRWTLEHAPERAAPALERARSGLERYRRPTAVGLRLRPLVARADPERMLRHGRLPDARWAEIWRSRLAATAERAGTLLENAHAARA